MTKRAISLGSTSLQPLRREAFTEPWLLEGHTLRSFKLLNGIAWCVRGGCMGIATKSSQLTATGRRVFSQAEYAGLLDCPEELRRRPRPLVVLDFLSTAKEVTNQLSNLREEYDLPEIVMYCRSVMRNTMKFGRSGLTISDCSKADADIAFLILLKVAWSGKILIGWHLRRLEVQIEKTHNGYG